MPPSDDIPTVTAPGGGVAGFGCGSFLGLLFWFGSVFFLHFPVWVGLSIVVVCAFLGYLYGDRFHERLIDLIRWLP